MHTKQGPLSFNAAHPGPKTITSEDEAVAELDEPPDVPIKFCKKIASERGSILIDSGPITSPKVPKASLLTQALLISPDLVPISDVDAPHLTSDGGMTSPTRTTTPSPPLPTTPYAGLPYLGSKELLVPVSEQLSVTKNVPLALGIDRKQETQVEETLGRKRCITFACGKRGLSPDTCAQVTKAKERPKETASSNLPPPKRPSILKFACPMKQSTTESRENGRTLKYRENAGSPQSPPVAQTMLETPSRHESQSGVIIADATTSAKSIPTAKDTKALYSSRFFNRIDFQKSEATSFHEFAGSYHTEDEWTNEQTAYRKTMTITDTLQKENAIRQLAEEAEAEALEEDVEFDDDGEDGEDDEDDVGKDVDRSVTDEVSDDGNETDDEEGFAESDDESETGYQFWTPGLTTAATSSDQIEHIRPMQQRVASESSIESVVKAESFYPFAPTLQDEHKQGLRRRKTPSRHPEAPNKPEEFIIGTLDEDRPLEDAYLSSLEQRKRSKHRLIPQDIDPSFPTSDPEGGDDGNESEDEEYSEGDAGQVNEAEWITGRPDSSEDEKLRSRKDPSQKQDKAPMPSPKRLHSPPPRRLFGQSSHRLRSPPPQHKKLASPPSSRRPSLTGSPPAKPRGVNMPHLAQRPNLTHTTSLPRTPNPFWDLHRKAKFREPETPSADLSPNTGGEARADYHSRGPIDIVQGLENKRQRRKEKFWRIHCQKAHAGKEKERKCQPGKGAERMREVGKEMQDRLKGYGHRANLMLSV
ncbi:MAG: hypothetical protein Q9217_001004 [Psora testacea]